MGRILFLANDGEGLYKFRKELLIELLKNNEVFVSLPKDKYEAPLKELKCTFIETGFERKSTNPLKDLQLLFYYRKLIRELKPDVVLTYTVKPNVYGGIACQLEKTPYIVNITGGVGSSPDDTGIVVKVVMQLYRIGLRKASTVFFQNSSNKEYMLKNRLLKEEQAVLIPGSGVNLDDYRLMEYPDGKTIDFTYIGRIMAEKGFDQYIEAAEFIRNKYPETRFHVCGGFEDDYKEKVDDLVNKKVLIYHGSVKNMKEIYEIIQCTVHPTYYPEGLSNVLLESLACGRPIITTDRPGCREVIDDGLNGFLVKQKDSEDLIKQIEKFISLSLEERKKLGLNGRRKVEDYFDRKIVINKYLEAINKANK